MASFIILSAIGPCPCPKDKLSNRRFETAEKVVIAPIGSVPGDRMKTNGVRLLESLNVDAKSNAGGSVYLSPRYAATNRVIAGTNRSGRIQLAGPLVQRRVPWRQNSPWFLTAVGDFY